MLSIPHNCYEYLFIYVNYKQRANLVIYDMIGYLLSFPSMFLFELINIYL